MNPKRTFTNVDDTVLVKLISQASRMKEGESMAVSELMMSAAKKAINATLLYEQFTNCGRKFGLMGEVGEILVCRKLGLLLVEDPRSKDFTSRSSTTTKA
ncbi:MAG: hypothetical protein O2960_28590 [Verrucomicrobia bacterium]|nr:hypothetical protein [Verrucomicrobiota bacterium]